MPQPPFSGEGEPRVSPLPPAPARRARTWDDCEAITEELAGRSLDPAYLELVVPVFRVAQAALDTEGRQVGEANVFPGALRLEVPTRWRTCMYPGSRYQAGKPMNASALKALRAHWSQALGMLHRIRLAYLERFPAARTAMTLGHAERLAVLVLAVVTYQLVKKEGRVANGELHPVLSAVFRMTEGLRMVIHQMLLVPAADAPLPPDTPASAEVIHAYAERNQSFHSEQGVCAGPAGMVDQFLRILVDGADASPYTSVALDEAVERALEDVEPAFQYGLLGLQAYAVVFSLWPQMTRTYARVAQILQNWSGRRTPALKRLITQVREKADLLQDGGPFASDEWRQACERVYTDMYAHCAAGLRDPVRQSLQERIAVRMDDQHREAAETLRAILQRHCCDGGDATSVDWLLDCLMHFFVRAQELLALASEIQERVNGLLGRPQPLRPFSVADVDIHVLLQGAEARQLPRLLDGLENLLGLHVDISSARLEIAEGSFALAEGAPAGDDIPSAADDWDSIVTSPGLLPGDPLQS
jgi:hypothetical protein